MRSLGVVSVMRCSALRRLLVALALLSLVLLAPAIEVPLGKVVERIECVGDAAQSYALFLPSSYDAAKRWPIVYCFDPRARGARALEPFREGAEKFGYILAASNNSRNGPWEQNKPAVEAVLRDTHGRFAIDSNRVYTAGMSGGGRLAVQLAMSKLARGVIACSAGFPTPKTPGAVKFAFFGTSGVDDSNYGEMRRVDDDLDAQGAVHRLALFAGGHEWPPVAVGTEAIEWLEIQAMRSGLRPRDEAVIDASFRARQAALPKNFPESWMELKSLAADFKGLRDVAALEQQAKELAAARAMREWRRTELQDEDEVQDLVAQVMQVANYEGVRDMERTIRGWRDEAAKADDSRRRRIVRRALMGASIVLEQAARTHFTGGDFIKASYHFEGIVIVNPTRTGIFFDWAKSAILAGEKKEALTALKEAAAAGYKDFAKIEQDDAFKSLRTEPSYRDALAAMKAAAAKP